MKITVTWIDHIARFRTERSAVECAKMQSIGSKALITYDDDITITRVRYVHGIEVGVEVTEKMEDLGQGWSAIVRPDGSATIKSPSSAFDLDVSQVKRLKELM